MKKYKKKDEFLATPELTKEELTKAFEECLKQIDLNMEYFKDKFPYSATKQNKYPIIENIEWTDGFWTGMLWLAYEYTKDEKYRELAEKNVDSFLHRVENRIELDHHDLGFLYSLSCVSAYKITGSEKAKRAALLAADKLMERWQEKGEFLQAWGPKDSPEHYPIHHRLHVKHPFALLGKSDDQRSKVQNSGEKALRNKLQICHP